MNDTWEYDGTNWTLVPTVQQPSIRQRLRLAFDSLRNRVVMFGGDDGAGPNLADTWEYDGSWQQVTTATRPPGRRDHNMTYDAARRRVVLFGGYNGSINLGDTWVYHLTSAWPDESCDNNSDDDADGLEDCADPDCDGLPCAGGVCSGGVCQ